MRRLFALCLLLCAVPLAWAARVPDPALLDRVGILVESQIAAGRLPGAVLLIGGEDGVYYRHAFGARAFAPERQAMTDDTIFDLASLTKVVATTTAVMQLVEQGRLDLDAPAARYWPGFAANGKADITVRQLLTHYSGLPADLDLGQPWSGIDAARRRIIAARPTDAPGSRYRYSDINFEVLGELVERVSGQPLDAYCREHIFAPLGMRDTGFRPAWSARIAPTGRNLVGVVNDPTARRMGGVAGHAGLFATADDLARFARMLLADGELDGVRILQPASVEAMGRPQSPDGQPRLRGLGWDVAAPFAADRDRLPPFGAYGHTGYTGTSLWIDPVSKLYVILLSNRVYPDGRGDVKPLRDSIAAALGEALGPLASSVRPAVVGYVAAPAP